jgi:hypothetical protein
MPRFLLPVALAAGVAAVSAQPPAEPADPDAAVLRRAGLDPADGPGLVGYLKARTANDTDKGKLDGLLKRFAADRFEDRQAASAEAARLGPVAVSPLRKAAEDKTIDPEIAYRAREALKTLLGADHSRVSAAVVRGVAKLKPPGAAAALIGFLPLADSEGVADDIRAALVGLAAAGGKADPALVAALTAPSPVVRAAAYTALVEGGPAGERVRIPDAFPAVKAAVRADPDVEAKFRGLWVLAHTTREKEFVPDLIALIPALPRGRLWQLEDFLLRLAGEHPKGGRFGRTPESLTKARDAWAGWWATGGADLAKADLTPRVLGFTDIMVIDPGFGRPTLVTLGPDMKEVWRLPSPDNSPVLPSDARVLPNGRVLVVEQSFQRVTERDKAGNTVSSYAVTLPLAAEVLPNGNWLVVSRMKVEEVKPGAEPQVVKSYARPRNAAAPGAPATGADISAARRLPDGTVVVVTGGGQGPNCFKLDDKLAPVGAPLTLGRVQLGNAVGLDVTAAGTIVVCEMNQVAEYQLATGKAVWAYDVPFAMSVQRLANGNTLIGATNLQRALEVTPEKEVVWEYRTTDGMSLQRAYRR